MHQDIFNPERMHTYLKGFACGAQMPQTIRALAFAREKHRGQFRRSGAPYVVHPLTMACNALALGLREDDLIATILLHDVCEDCGVPLEELPVNDKVKQAVDLMTFRVLPGETKDQAKERYYDALLQSREASICKLIDRCHNVSSMAGTFSVEKLKSYIEETRHYVVPLLRKVKLKYPEDSEILFVLKYHMLSVVDSIDATLQIMDQDHANAPDGNAPQA